MLFESIVYLSLFLIKLNKHKVLDKSYVIK